MSAALARGAAASPRELLAFALVGTAALVVHFGVVSISVPRGVPPLGANVLGFLAAFTLSFVGHDRWSFPAAQPRSWAALRRFFAVALLGFAINESSYALLLSSTHLDYRAALLVVLAVVAGSTLLLSKHWAFADEH